MTEMQNMSQPFQVSAVRPMLWYEGGLNGSPYMAVLGPNNVYLCYYQVIGISRGPSVIIKTKIFHPILKIDQIMTFSF